MLWQKIYCLDIKSSLKKLGGALYRKFMNEKDNWDDDDDEIKADDVKVEKFVPSHLRREAKIYSKLFGEGFIYSN